MSASPPPSVPVQAPERETSSVELLWDLVFVFAVTQVTTLLAAQYRSSRAAGEADAAPVSASPPQRAAARVSDPDHGLE